VRRTEQPFVVVPHPRRRSDLDRTEAAPAVPAGKVSQDALCQNIRFMQTESGKESATERWSSVEEVTEHLGVGRDTIYRWIERMALPAHRVGRLWKFKLSEVDSWVRVQGLQSKQATPKDGHA